MFLSYSTDMTSQSKILTLQISCEGVYWPSHYFVKLNYLNHSDCWSHNEWVGLEQTQRVSKTSFSHFVHRANRNINIVLSPSIQWPPPTRPPAEKGFIFSLRSLSHCRSARHVISGLDTPIQNVRCWISHDANWLPKCLNPPVSITVRCGSSQPICGPHWFFLGCKCAELLLEKDALVVLAVLNVTELFLCIDLRFCRRERELSKILWGRHWCWCPSSCVCYKLLCCLWFMSLCRQVF